MASPRLCPGGTGSSSQAKCTGQRAQGAVRVMGEGPELGTIWKWAQVRAGREPVARVQGGY